MTGAYDYDVNAAFTENYHYGTGTNFQISLNQNSFTGYDSESGSSFSGSFEGSNLTIFVGGKRYNYSI